MCLCESVHVICPCVSECLCESVCTCPRVRLCASVCDVCVSYQLPVPVCPYELVNMCYPFPCVSLCVSSVICPCVPWACDNTFGGLSGASRIWKQDVVSVIAVGV